MTITVETDDGIGIKSEYYKGDISPLPQVGHTIMGTFGRGDVSKVKHYVESDSYSVVLEFTNLDQPHINAGF